MGTFPIKTGTVIEFFGKEITWEILGSDVGWFVRASHHGETEGDTFKFEASHKNLDQAVGIAGRAMWRNGPEWIRNWDNLSKKRRVAGQIGRRVTNKARG